MLNIEIKQITSHSEQQLCREIFAGITVVAIILPLLNSEVRNMSYEDLPEKLAR